MLINVYCPAQDKTFSMDVGPELTLEVFKTLCHAEIGNIPVESMEVVREGQKLSDNNKQLRQLNIAENDFLIIERKSGQPSRPPSNQGRSNSTTPVIDFSNVQVPTASSTSSPRAPQSTTRAPSSGSSYDDLSDVEAVAAQLRNDPSTLALLRERNPALAEALLSNDMSRFSTELGRIRTARADQEMERIRMLNADPMDPDFQRRIAEEIERKNIEENMNMAIENAPESFGQVVMLWINVRVNGYHVKAFVDSGAQMTIMSGDCAERCNIMRLMDKRFAGIAKGVGTQPILGKVHMAQIQIENIFLPVSFSVMPEQPMDVLLGLDMLRRHQCVINLSDNSLTLATPNGNTKTYFLGEAEIPNDQKISQQALTPSGETPKVSAGAPTPSSSTAAALPSSTEQKSSTDEKSTGDKEGGEKEEEKMETSTTSPTPSAAVSQPSTTTTTEESDKLSQLADMGFSLEESKKELQECGGNLQNAIASLLRKKGEVFNFLVSCSCVQPFP